MNGESLIEARPSREEMLEMALLMYVTAHEHLLVCEGFETEGARRMTRRYRIAREALEWDNEPNAEPFMTIHAPFDECANCGSKASENVSWSRTGGWSCAACGESDYPEAAE